MSKDVSANGLLRIDSICHAATGVSHHLVGDKDSDVELFANLLDLAQHSAQNLLSLSQLSSPREIHAVRRDDGVNNHE